MSESEKIRILVVDDDPILLRILRDRLGRAGYEVSTRDSTIGTSEWILRNRPDLVLLDVGMPALSGTELATILRRHGLSRQTGVVLHSGLSRSELEQLRLSTGALGVIQKSGDDGHFLREISIFAHEILRRRAARVAGCG